MAHTTNIVPSQIFIERAERPGIAPAVCIHSGVLSPAHASPSAATAGSAERSFTHADRSTVGPPAYLPSGATLGLALLPLSTAPLSAAPPSAAAVGSAAPYFARANQYMAGPLAYPSSGSAPGLAFAPLSATPPSCAFAPLSATVPWFAHAGTSAPTMFQGDIMSGNAFAHVHSPPGPSST